MSERDTSDIRLGSVNFASHMLRRAIVVLMVLVPLSAIYAFVFGGVAGGANADIFYVRGTPGMPFTIPLPPPPPGGFMPLVCQLPANANTDNFCADTTGFSVRLYQFGPPESSWLYLDPTQCAPIPTSLQTSNSQHGGLAKSV
jgi:hypothetical protein